MKIIIVGPNFKNYKSSSYQYEFIKALKEISSKYFHYSNNKEISIKELCKKAKFIPNLIFYNHGWLLDNPNINEITYTNIKNHFSDERIKHVLFLNKEYARLDNKLSEIMRYKFDLVFTHLHDFDLWNKKNISSIFLPLACSHRNVSKYRKRKLKYRKYDLFFSGILQNWNFRKSQPDLRKKIQIELFYCLFDFPILKKYKYRDLNIYWKPFYKSRIKNFLSNLLHNKRLSQKEYFNTLSNSKCVLHTSSPLGIISTRIFEALGSGAIGLFSKNSNADIIFQENIDYLSFDSIEDLINKVYLIKGTINHSKFQTIADSGREHVELRHTWRNRAATFKKSVKKLLS